MSGENPIDLDPDELAREADRVDLPPENDAGPAPRFELKGEAPAVSTWAAYTPGVSEVVSILVCPGWHLTDQEKESLADALTPVLEDLFPGGLGDPRWAPYFRLVAVAGGIVLSRYDPEAGRFPPLQEPDDQAEGERQERPAPSKPAGTRKPFTTVSSDGGE